MHTKHVEESKRLELGQLSQLKEHVDLVIESEAEQRVQIDGLGKAEAVHQREDTLSDCKLVLQVDGAKVEEAEVQSSEVDALGTTHKVGNVSKWNRPLPSSGMYLLHVAQGITVDARQAVL